MAAPGSYNLEIYQGDTFKVTVRLRSRNADGSLGAYLDLTGCTAKAQIRSTEASDTVIAEFVTEILDQTATPGGVKLSLTHGVTAALAPTSAAGELWDMQITFADGTVTTYLRGGVKITAEVTR